MTCSLVSAFIAPFKRESVSAINRRWNGSRNARMARTQKTKEFPIVGSKGNESSSQATASVNIYARTCQRWAEATKEGVSLKQGEEGARIPRIAAIQQFWMLLVDVISWRVSELSRSISLQNSDQANQYIPS